MNLHEMVAGYSFDCVETSHLFLGMTPHHRSQWKTLPKTWQDHPSLLLVYKSGGLSSGHLSPSSDSEGTQGGWHQLALLTCLSREKKTFIVIVKITVKMHSMDEHGSQSTVLVLVITQNNCRPQNLLGIEQLKVSTIVRIGSL